jgi:hypothetical protein
MPSAVLGPVDPQLGEYPAASVLAAVERKDPNEVSTELPDQVRLLMRLYPQPRGRRPSVEYIPMPYDTPRPARPVPPGPAGARP